MAKHRAISETHVYDGKKYKEPRRMKSKNMNPESIANFLGLKDGNGKKKKGKK